LFLEILAIICRDRCQPLYRHQKKIWQTNATFVIEPAPFMYLYFPSAFGIMLWSGRNKKNILSYHFLVFFSAIERIRDASILSLYNAALMLWISP
jgi:hypothetical protein